MKSELLSNICLVLMMIIHQACLIMTRGFSISLFNHIVLGNQLVQACLRFGEELSKWSQFGKFMERLERDFPKVKFVLKSSVE